MKFEQQILDSTLKFPFSWSLLQHHRHLLRQKVRQRISVKESQLKITKTQPQVVQCLFSIMRFFDKLFDVMNDYPFFTL